MKKLLISSLMLGMLAVIAPAVEAKSSATAISADPQINVRVGQPRRRYNRRTRTVISTRVRWVGRYRYRETIRTTYMANGRTRTQVIQRVRLSGRRNYRSY